MTDLHLLDPAAAVAGLRACADARGFLGLDPVTDNDALLAREMTRLGAQVFTDGEALLGYRPNPAQPRQAYVASTTAEPGPLRAFLRFLRTYQRCTSFVALVTAGSPAAGAFRRCGFEPAGTLRDHRYQAGHYTDVQVFHANGEDTCRS